MFTGLGLRPRVNFHWLLDYLVRYMDYIKAPLFFKIRKVLRYVKIYGLGRTLIKIKSQLHMAKTDEFTGDVWTNPRGSLGGDVAMVGCGNFAYSTIAFYVSKSTPGKIKYALDINKSRSMSLAKTYNVYQAVSDFDSILTDPEISLIYIASNHHSHAEYAARALEFGKNVHIEKPHAVNEAQLEKLAASMVRNPNSKVFLGYNRPKSRLFKKLMSNMEYQSGPVTVNWFIAGHEIEADHWYFSEKEGGRVLGNLCHWSDLTIHLVGLDNCFPCTISPAVDPQSTSDFSYAISFADGSQAGFTFSAKGHTFEGVREYLNLHKGNLLANLQDFGSLEMSIGETVTKIRSLYRDHGHKKNIQNSYIKAKSDDEGEDLFYVYASGLLILKMKEATDAGLVVTCNPKHLFPS